MHMKITDNSFEFLEFCWFSCELSVVGSVIVGSVTVGFVMDGVVVSGSFVGLSELSGIVDQRNELEVSSKYEVEIRASQIVVIDYISNILINANPIDINDFIFVYSKRVKSIVKPYHLCRNTNYWYKLQFYIIMNKKVFLVNGSIFFYADIYYSFW